MAKLPVGNDEPASPICSSRFAGCHGERRESLVEVLERQSDRLADEGFADRVLEGDQLRAGAPFDDRVAPGALDVSDAAERAAALRMGEQALGQRGCERGIGELRRLVASRGVRKTVAGGRSAAEAGEEEREQACDVGVVRYVGAGEVLAAGNRARPRPSPVLAYDRALLGALVGVAGRESHPMARREQKSGRRRVPAREHSGESLVGRRIG